MKTKFFSFLVTLCLLLSSVVYAGPVTRNQAQQIATQFLTTHVQGHRAASVQNMKASALLGAVDEEGQPYLYVVSNGDQGGYVIVSGDDRMRQVVGYSATGTFSEQDMPSNMRAWLQGYVDEMKHLQAVGYQPSKQSQRRAASTKAPISKMLSTTWNQGAPYNMYSPLFVDGVSKCHTGCTATALAQVMYYQAMKSGLKTTTLLKDIPAYTCWRTWENKQQISVPGVAAGAVIDWTKMQDSYKDTDNDESAQAVAQLMQLCGRSLNMDYAAGNNSSLAGDKKVPTLMSEDFGFSSSARKVYRSIYSYGQWVELMYGELEDGRPVLFGGHTSQDGHEFVLDGYDSNDLFHVNWGWGGSWDNYFALSVLDPGDNSGIGASVTKEGYSSNQSAIIGIQATGEINWAPVLTTYYIKKTGDASIEAAVINYLDRECTYKCGLATIVDGEFSWDITLWDEYTAKVDYYGYKNYTFNDNPKNAGKSFDLYIVTQELTSDYFYTTTNMDKYITLSFDANGKASVTVHGNTPVLKATDISFTNIKFAGVELSVNATVQNTGDEFCNWVYMQARSEDGADVVEDSIATTILHNASSVVKFDFIPKQASKYAITVSTDKAGTHVIGTQSVTVSEMNINEHLKNQQMVIAYCEYDGQVDGTATTDANGVCHIQVKGNTAKGTVVLKNLSSEGISRYNIEPMKYNEATGKYEKLSTYYSWYNRTLAAGASTVINFKEENLSLGKYCLRVYKVILNENNKVSEVITLDNHCTFTLVDETTGINSLTGNSTTKGMEGRYYTLDGRLLNGKPTQKGVYILNGRKLLIK